MAYFLAPSLVQLRNEINAANPGRDKSSDGWIGDASHAARKSDHNPDYSAGGIVRAIDVDVDGCDPDKLIAVAIADPRTEYVISRGFIYERLNGFRKRKYTGSNDHSKHTHISIRTTAAGAAAGAWGFSGGGGAPAPSGGSRPSFEQVVADVIAGKYGNGEERARRVSAAGQDYNAVRAEVNRRLGGGAPASTKKSNAQIAQEVRAGLWGNGDDRRLRLGAAGYDYNAIQAIINSGGAPAPAAPARKTNDQIAQEVIRGEWGNGSERSRRLQAAGYSPTAIQAIVNGQGVRGPVRLSNTAVARQVIAGEWGNGNERRTRLTQAGYNYEAVRAEVNRLV